MIELEVLAAGERRPVLLAVDNIGTMSPLATDRTLIVTRDGRELQVVGEYADIRAAVIRVRSGFETLIA
jgi:hypothetical protein